MKRNKYILQVGFRQVDILQIGLLPCGGTLMAPWKMVFLSALGSAKVQWPGAFSSPVLLQIPLASQTIRRFMYCFSLAVFKHQVT